MRPLQLSVPTAEQLNALEGLYLKTHNVRECRCAQMVLLALEKQLKVVEIAAIITEVDETVRHWLTGGRLVLLYLPIYSPWLNPIEMR